MILCQHFSPIFCHFVRSISAYTQRAILLSDEFSGCAFLFTCHTSMSPQLFTKNISNSVEKLCTAPLQIATATALARAEKN